MSADAAPAADFEPLDPAGHEPAFGCEPVFGHRVFDALDPDVLARRDGEKWAYAPEDTLSAWIGDMDFPIAPEIRAALIRRIDGDLGYPVWFDGTEGAPLGEVFAARMKRRFGFAAEPTHLRLFTDVNQAMSAVLHLATRPGDAVVLHTPACPPFVDDLRRMDRPPLTVPIEEGLHGWTLDPDRVAATLDRAKRCRVLFLVNPHNPTGRVLRRDELEGLAELALRHDLLVISDEVHADLTHPPHLHIPFASLGPEVAARTVTVTSGSKAFNLAGIRCAAAHIGPPELRDAVDARRGLLFGQVGVLAVAALEAAWSEGDAWLDEVRVLLDRNRRRLAAGLPEGIRHHSPEAGFLAWLDCRPLGLGDDPYVFFRDHARVLLFSGPSFGPEGSGFARLNFATSAGVLDEILNRMHAALRAPGRI
ncbi:MalY/PatB family protein [Embleya sp. NPDC056575]|uniref:MalY/PatB family protein n=1 Tax=unclassified Embleya TaxID=2699296 RepID=UPI0036B7C4F0